MRDLSGYTVKRLFINPSMIHDRFDILYPDGTAVNCGYQTAHDFMLNKLDPSKLKQEYTSKPGVFLV